MNLSIEEALGQLKVLRIQKDKKYAVGKRIQSNVWVHKSYAHLVRDVKYLALFSKHLPENFTFDVVRFDDKKEEVCFIHCPEFDVAHEPIVSETILVKKVGEHFEVGSIRTEPKNPVIYHHKHLFVGGDYKGFDLLEAMNRSIAWKSVAGVDKSLTSRIGRKDFWEGWLYSNGLESRSPQDKQL